MVSTERGLGEFPPRITWTLEGAIAAYMRGNVRLQGASIQDVRELALLLRSLGLVEAAQ